MRLGTERKKRELGFSYLSENGKYRPNSQSARGIIKNSGGMFEYPTGPFLLRRERIINRLSFGRQYNDVGVVPWSV